MQPAPTAVYKCPNCDNLLSVARFFTGSSENQKGFSDGKWEAPFHPEFPIITRCSRCETIFWITEVHPIGQYKPYCQLNEPLSKINRRWLNAEPAPFLTINEYIQALTDCTDNIYDKEIFIRKRILWDFNDRVRTGEPLFSNDSDRIVFSDNIYRLLKILTIHDFSEKLLFAELQRYLGNFEKCMDLLTNPQQTYSEWLINAFENECDQKNTIVFQYPIRENYRIFLKKYY